MIQQKLKLSSEFKQTLKECDEIWVAVALVSDNGYKYIQDNINKKAKQNYLVGVGLPTSPKVLLDLKNKEGKGLFKSKIYHKPDKLFHPKVYIVKSGKKLVAFVGSGNCTDGGFDKNIELSIKTDDKDFCNNILKWYDDLFKFGISITDDFLISYSILFERRSERTKQDKNELNSIFPDNNSKVNLNEINFANQFFKKEHFSSFEGIKPWDKTIEINNERIKVRDKLYKLHEKLYPIIKKQKWDLHEHYVYDDTVSSAIHGLVTGPALESIWLSYGRSKTDIKDLGEKETPLNSMRLQVIIHKDSIGIWNCIGKDSGNEIDRRYFKNKISNDKNYRKKFYTIIKQLPDNFFIIINQQKKYVNEFISEQKLTDFVLTDELKDYFIIGIEFNPDDIKLSESNIVDTIIENFGNLYLTYDLMRYKMKLQTT